MNFKLKNGNFCIEDLLFFQNVDVLVLLARFLPIYDLDISSKFVFIVSLFVN